MQGRCGWAGGEPGARRAHPEGALRNAGPALGASIDPSAVPLTIPLDAVGDPDPSLIGGKSASLVRLHRAGFPVPTADLLTTRFFAPWIEALTTTTLWRDIQTLLANADDRDQGSLEALCAQAKEHAAKLPINEVQRRTLDDIAAGATTGLLAVRSSSPQEDLAGASFAGLYASELNVCIGDLDAAVRRCFASSVDLRVVLYKAERHLEPTPSFSAVVQRQVASEVSGVAFSLNPRNNDFDQAVINASWGLGEALVSGQIEPDQWVVDKVGGKTIASRCGAKGGERPDAFCLDDRAIAVVKDCLCAVESLLDEPVDIEWAFADGQLHLLQARPITTYVPLPKAMQTAPGEPRLLYMDPGLGEGITMSGAVSPLSVDLYARLFEWLGDYAFGPSFFAADLKRGIVGAGGARLYGNVSNLMHFRDMKKVAPEKRFVDTTLAELFATVDFEPYRTEPPANFAKRQLVPALFKALVRLRPFFPAMLRAVLRPAAFLDRYGVDLAEFDKAVADTDHQAPIRELAKRLYAAVGRVSLIATAPAMLLFIYGGTDALMRVIDSRSPRQQRLAMDIRGGGDELVLEMGLSMYRLARLLPAARFRDLAALERDIEARRLPMGFLAAWDEFLHRFGSRGPAEMDLAFPKYRDDPRMLLHQLALLALGDADPVATHVARGAARQAAYAELSSILRGRKRRKLARIYETLRDFEQVREMPKHHVTIANGVLRQRLLHLAGRWVAAGRLDRVEDVFEMTLDDVARAETDSDLELRTVVAERGAFYRDAKARVRHFPHLIDSRGRILRPVREYRFGEMTGVAVSPGTARGPVKVLDSPLDNTVLPGEVLVAHTTDPGWTPLFINAAAVLLEVGGELQHGALLAREYGKPCVAGIVGLTDLLSDGQVVEVDGDAGVVRIV